MTDLGMIHSAQSAYLGGYLAADAALSATSLVVDSIVDFSETGGSLTLNGVTYAYAAANFDTNTITLATGLTGAALTQARVDVAPVVVEKTALVMVPNTEDALTVLVPHALMDRIPEGIREEGARETVLFDKVDDRFVITDILGREPVIDGSFIDPATVPPAPSDGLPPSSSPALTAQGNIGAIHYRWTPVANADPVKFNLHISTTPGFTVGSGNLVATTASSSFTYVPSPLDYTATYYARLVEFDDDGGAAPSAEVAAQLRQATNADISAAYAYLGQVLVDQLTGGTLNASVLLAGAFRTGDAGARRTIDSTGDVWYDSAGTPTIVLPVEGTAQFKGDGEIGNLTVTNGSAFRGSLNEVSKNGAFTLQEGTTAPQAAPSVVIGWDSVVPTYANDYGYGLVWTGTDWAILRSATIPAVYRYPTTGGGFTSIINLGDINSPRPEGGLARIGTSWYTLGVKDSNGLSYITKYSDTGVQEAQVQVGYQATPVFADGAAIGTDGTNILTARFDATNARYIIETRDPTTLALTSTLNTASNAGFTGPVTGVARGTFDLGATRTIIVSKNGLHYYPFDSTGTYIAAEAWPVPVTGLAGFAWDGTRFHGAKYDAGNSRIYKHTTLNWTTESATWWTGATWRDTNPAGVGTYESDLSPKSSFTMKKRARLTLTSAAIPAGGTDDPNAVSFYLGRGTTSPDRTAMWRQTLPANGVNTATLDTFTFTGTNPPATNGFLATASPAKIKTSKVDGSGNPHLALEGDGDIFRGPDAAMLLTQVLTANCTANVDLITTEVDITGATLTFTTTRPGARYLCTGSFYFSAIAASSGVASGKLSVDGSIQARFVNFTGSNSVPDRANLSQTWAGTLASAGSHTLKLRGIGSESGSPNPAAQRVNATHSTITVMVFE